MTISEALGPAAVVFVLIFGSAAAGVSLGIAWMRGMEWALDQLGLPTPW